jgi:thiol-disulfide isomerase/thioredoxin
MSQGSLSEGEEDMRTVNPLLVKSGRLAWIFIVAGLVFVSHAMAGLAVGDLVEAFSLEKGGGGTFQFPGDVKGKVVFLNFWASWCPECKVELPELVEIEEKFKDRPFVLLAVNMDRKRKAAEKFLSKVGLDIMVLYDNEQKVINAFAPVGVPASYLIGPDGKVVKVYVGFKKDYIEMYIDDIKALMEEQAPVPTPAEKDQEASQP